DPLGEPLRRIQRRRAADEVAPQGLQPAVELRLLARLGPGPAELVERRDQRLRHVAAPVGAEALLDRAAHPAATALCAASKKAAIAAWSLRPGSLSTPLATSTA